MFLCTDKEANVILVRKSSIKDVPQFWTLFFPVVTEFFNLLP
jgi:hypothetical protein